MPAFDLLHRFAGQSLLGRAADRFLNSYAPRRVRALDQQQVARTQQRTLLQLVQRARDTRFGREHDFGRIRTIPEYQRRVPLRDYEAFWTGYWQQAFPVLDGVTWPGPIPYFALSSGTTSGATKYLPISPQMLASNRRAAFTLLALLLAAYPRTPLFAGQLFFLGGSTALENLTPADRFRTSNIPILAGDLSGIAAREVASVLRPYTFPPLDLALLTDWERKVDLLAERSAHLPITLLSGVPSWMLVLFDRLKKVTGKTHIADVWPTLQVIVHGGTKFDAYRTLFKQQVGSESVRYLETYPCSEGFIAIEDPRSGFLRVVPDHNLFYEFVPVEDLTSDRPARHTLADVEVGVQYAVVLTTCAGLWSYVLGDTVRFEQTEPPLLRFTGRTKYFLSAFGEHLINEEVETSIAQAAEATGATAIDFHVGPIFPDQPGQVGRHRYLVEFAHPPADLERFALELDCALGRLNADYLAHRVGDLTMARPEIVPVPTGGFLGWLRARGKLGGQHKVPRMDNSGALTLELTKFFADFTPS